MLTGLDDETIAIKSLKIGAQDYLVKDEVNSELLERSICYAIERFKVEMDLRLSELKHREAYNRAKFYKDMFVHDLNNVLQGILSATQVFNIVLEPSKNT